VELYDSFYNNDACIKLLAQDLIATFKESVMRINNLIDPVTYPSFKKDDGKIKIKKHSLRGDSRFVQMAVVKMDDRKCTPNHLNDYLDEVMTYETNAIEGVYNGQRQPDKDLLTYMYKKDHKVQSAKSGETVRKRHSVNMIKNGARDPDNPIYLSYTQADLDLCHDQPSPYAIYYFIGEKQPIGATSLHNLINKENKDASK